MLHSNAPNKNKIRDVTPIYFNFLLKASWACNFFYFLSIPKFLQVKIQACFS